MVEGTSLWLGGNLVAGAAAGREDVPASFKFDPGSFGVAWVGRRRGAAAHRAHQLPPITYLLKFNERARGND